MKTLIAVVKYAFFWQVTQVRNVHRTGVNAVPVPYIDKLIGIFFGTCAVLILFSLLGWVLGTWRYYRSGGADGI